MSLRSTHAATAGAAPAPMWVHLLPAGNIRTTDGRGPYRLSDAQSVVVTSMRVGKLVIDENHSTDLAVPEGRPAPACGWIVELQGRHDGIWGRVEWTRRGHAMMEDRQYSSISPVIQHRRDGTITAILRAGLTNAPNLVGLAALQAAQMTRAPTRAGLRSTDLHIISLMGLDPAAYARTSEAARRQDDSAAASSVAPVSYDLSTADQRIIALMGLDPDAYLRTKGRF